MALGKQAGFEKQNPLPGTTSLPPRDNHGLLQEILRIAAFTTPIVVGFALVDFCSSCLDWGLAPIYKPDASPTLDGFGLLAGCLFLVVYWTASRVQRDGQRALRTPVVTLRKETASCANVAGGTVAGLLVAWTLVPVWKAVGIPALVWVLRKTGHLPATK